jgi:lysozyme
MINPRLTVFALSLSAAAFVGIVQHESYTSTAVIPTKNDRPTVGFGSTFRDDGTPVRMGDTINPVQAVVRSVAHIAKDEAGLKRCVTGQMSQTEYDILVDFSYQYGTVAACNSGVARNVNAGNYLKACESYTEYKYLTTKRPTIGWTPYKFDANGKPIRWRFDCSTPGNRVCSGVWKRNLERQTKCLEAQ